MRSLIQPETEWISPLPIPSWSVLDGLDESKLVASILYRRGHSTPELARAFTDALHAPLPSPESLIDMDAAVQRIATAISRREKVAIFGDYDVDGVTSTAILALALRAAMPGHEVITRLPERSEGYGLNSQAIEEFHEAGVNLVIAVDCGSTDHDHAALIRSFGMDLVIFDHHHLSDDGPAEAITVSPQRSSDPALHDLTGAGVAWLAVVGLREAGCDVGDPAALLDLAALGSVADVAPVNGINRGLIARGVLRIRSASRPGIAAVLQAAGIESGAFRATDIAFAIGPRLNAAGRLESPKLALDLMLAPDIATARPLALLLEQVNMRRKTRSGVLHQEAEYQIASHPDWATRPLFALQATSWEGGLIGAVASRLAEEYRRPVVMFRREGSTLHGSARSVDGFHLVDALAAFADRLDRFGGHGQAAGITLNVDHLDALQGHLEAAIASSGVTIPAPKTIRIDAQLPEAFITPATVRDIARLEPFGRGNEEPTLLVKDATLWKYSTMGSDRSHLKIEARLGKTRFDAILWRGAERSKELVGARSVDLVGKLRINEWMGQERVQLILDDLRPA